MRAYCWFAMFPTLLLAAATPSPAADWTVPAVNISAYSMAGQLRSTAYDPDHAKLYLGHGSYDTTALAVFDLGSEGEVASSPRRYPVHPDYMPPDNVCYVRCLFLDKAHAKLFMGLSFHINSYPDCLTVYNLDAQGEPTGTVQAFATGSPYGNVVAMARHPSLDRLYTVGWGSPAVHILDLDANGLPTGAPASFAVAPYGKYSVSFRSDGTKLYLGTYPYTLEVCDLDAAGNVVGGHTDYVISGGPSAYLEMVANDEGVYFSLDDSLAYFELDAAGDPTGSPVVVSNLPVQAVGLSATGSLILAEFLTYADAVSGATISSGTVVRERSVGTNAAPGTILRESQPFTRRTLDTLGTRSDASVLLTAATGFQGNRFSGLCVRFVIDAIVPDGTLAVDPESVPLSAKNKYLYFAQSTNHNVVYATGDNTLLAYALDGTGAVVSVACTNAMDAVTVDDELGVVYVAISDGSVEVRALDTNGVPAASGENMATEISIIRKLCVNPESHHVYVCGHGVNPGPVPGAATPARQRLVQVVGSTYFTDAAVDPARQRLYGCRQYNAHNNIMVWRLNADGTLLDTTATYYDDGIPPGTNNYRGLVNGVHLDADRSRAYFAGQREQSADQASIIVYTLDANGDPSGGPRVHPTLNAYGTVYDIALSTNKLWLYDVGHGNGAFFGRQLDASGEPTGEILSWSVGNHGKRDLAMTPDGTRLLMGSYPSKLEIVPMQPSGRPREGLGATLAAGSLSEDLGFVTWGGVTTTAWVNLDQALSNVLGDVTGTLTFDGGSLSGSTVRVEFALANGAGLVTLTNVNYTVVGEKGTIFLPGYDIDDPALDAITSSLETEGSRYGRYLGWAHTYGPAVADRPRQFIVSTMLIGNGSGFEELDSGLEALGTLGINTLEVKQFADQVTPCVIHQAATNRGIDHFRSAVYRPPSYFDFDTNLMDAAYLDDWADGFTNNVLNMGASLDELAWMKMADEPGWYFPRELNSVTSTVGGLQVFQDYLQSNAPNPEFFGHTDWTNILPLGLSGATNLPSNRLLYWTARFFPESASRMFAAATAALRRRLNTNLYVSVNFNNWPGRYFKPSPNVKIGNNPDIGPDSAMGAPDWFDFGRNHAVSMQWSEDWFTDPYSQNWSYYADLLRCSAREGEVPFGAYLVGRATGSFPEGGMYKLMALAGHGAKAFAMYTFGPEYTFPGNCWSEREQTYESLGNGLELLGRCEDLLYPGVPKTGTVGILLPQASQVWDPDSRVRMYLYELFGLHAGLIHEQFPVDFVDDVGIAEGDLDTYGYAALYVTAPNLATNAQAIILDWVNRGGTLALLPGACSADEYDSATSVLASDMGASWDAVSREEAPNVRDTSRAVIEVLDSRLGTTGDVTRAQTAPLTLSGATALATFTNGDAAVSESLVGSGRIIAYGYWPGSTYALSRDTFDKYSLPRYGNPNARKILTAPARIAGAGKHVTLSDDVVEGAVVESDAGLAVVLLNWTGEPLPQLTVNIPITTRMADAIQRSALTVDAALATVVPYTATATNLAASLPLDAVDVLLLTYATPPQQSHALIRLR